MIDRYCSNENSIIFKWLRAMDHTHFSKFNFLVFRTLWSDPGDRWHDKILSCFQVMYVSLLWDPYVLFLTSILLSLLTVALSFQKIDDVIIFFFFFNNCSLIQLQFFFTVIKQEIFLFVLPQYTQMHITRGIHEF